MARIAGMLAYATMSFDCNCFTARPAAVMPLAGFLATRFFVGLIAAKPPQSEK